MIEKQAVKFEDLDFALEEVAPIAAGMPLNAIGVVFVLYIH